MIDPNTRPKPKNNLIYVVSADDVAKGQVNAPNTAVPNALPAPEVVMHVATKLLAEIAAGQHPRVNREHVCVS
ncbi:MAG: hypothetical protein WCG09_04990 [Halobacteriota archaeon]